MKNNKGKIIKISIILSIIFLVIIGITVFIINRKENNNGKKENTSLNENIGENNEIKNLDILAENDFFVLYNGVEIPKKTGRVDLSEIKNNLESEKQTRYNGRKYYNYEKEGYVGETVGEFSFEADEDYKYLNFVSNVEKIAITKKYEAIPRTVTRLETIPEELKEAEKYTIHEIESIDLDGDQKQEYIVLLGEFYEKGQIGNDNPIANSRIMLVDSDFKQSINLIELADGFTSEDRDTDTAEFLTLDDDIMYIDIDEDGIMEIIINIPKIEGEEINIVKYSNGKIEGDTNIKANIYPGNDIKLIAKKSIQKYLDIYSLLDNGAELLYNYFVFDDYGENLYKSSEELEQNLQESDETIDLNGESVQLYKTNINFNYFKSLLLNYISEGLFEKQIMPYCKNINGELYMTYYTGEENFYEATDIEQIEGKNIFRVKYVNVIEENTKEGTLLVNLGQDNSGKYIITDCVFEK